MIPRAKEPNKALTFVTRDSVIARRLEGVFPKDKAELKAARLGALPTILEAWIEPANNSHNFVVCWIPNTTASQNKAQEIFTATEMAKAASEGCGMRFTPLRHVHRIGWACIQCYNPRSGGVYRVFRAVSGQDTQYECQCRRWRSAGICKHILAAILFEAQWPAPTPMPEALTYEQFAARRSADFD